MDTIFFGHANEAPFWLAIGWSSNYYQIISNARECCGTSYLRAITKKPEITIGHMRFETRCRYTWIQGRLHHVSLGANAPWEILGGGMIFINLGGKVENTCYLVYSYLRNVTLRIDCMWRPQNTNMASYSTFIVRVKANAAFTIYFLLTCQHCLDLIKNPDIIWM